MLEKSPEGAGLAGDAEPSPAVRSWLAPAATFAVLGAVTTCVFVWSTRAPGEAEMARMSAAWFVVACAAAIFLGRRGSADLVRRLGRLIEADAKRSAVTLSLALLVLLLILARAVLDAFPNSGDEYAYVLQAETYARGRLWVDAPQPARAFQLMRFIEKSGRWISIYQPGWAVLLTLPLTVGLPAWIVSPLLGAGLAYAFFRLAARTVRPEAAWLGTFALCTSSFFLLNFASFFSHGAGAFAAVLFALAGVRYLEEGETKWAVLAGIFIGALGFIRAINAVFLAVPYVVALALSPKRWKGFLGLALGGAPFALLLLAYNEAVTGNPLLLVQAWASGEPLGAPSIQSVGETYRRLVRLFLWTSPVIFVGFPLAFVAVARRRQLSFVDFMTPITLVGFATYGGNGGNQYGPRYYFEGWPFALITVAKAIEPYFSPARGRSELGAALLLSHLAFQLGYLAPRVAREHTVVVERQSLYERVRSAGITNAVILVLDDVGHVRPLPPRDLLRNGLEVGDEPVTYALDKGDEMTLGLMKQFPGRRFYRHYRNQLHDVFDASGKFISKPPGFY